MSCAEYLVGVTGPLCSSWWIGLPSGPESAPSPTAMLFQHLGLFLGVSFLWCVWVWGLLLCQLPFSHGLMSVRNTIGWEARLSCVAQF